MELGQCRAGAHRFWLTAPVPTLPAMTRPVPKVTLCHGTSGSNPYIEIEVDVASILRQGHDQHTHEGRHDIIPPFMFIGRDGLVIFPGLGDQSVLANHCQPPDDDPPPTTSTSTTSTTSTTTATTSTTTTTSTTNPTTTTTSSTSTTIAPTTTTCPDCGPTQQSIPGGSTTTTVVVTQQSVPGGPTTSTTTTCPNCGATTTTLRASFVAAPSGALPFTSQPASAPVSGPLAFSGAEDSLMLGLGLSAILVGALLTRFRRR